MTTIVRLQAPDGDTYTWETGDGVFVGGECTLQQGRSASTLRVELADPRLELANALPLPRDEARIDVECWFGAPQAPPKVFAGFVASYTATATPDRITILAVDRAKGARRVRKARNLTGVEPLELVEQIAGEHDLDVDVSEADLDEVAFASVLQHGETDIELLDRLLQPVGHSVFARGDTLYVRRFDALRDDGEVIRLRYGVNVAAGARFEIDEHTPRNTPNLFDHDGEPAHEDDDVEAVDRPVHLERTGLAIQTEDEPSYSSQALQRAMEAEARSGQAFQATIQATEAFPEADVDDQVVLEGFGPRYSGVWNVDSVTHQLHPEKTGFSLYRGGQ